MRAIIINRGYAAGDARRDAIMTHSYQEISTGKRRTCAGCLARLIVRGGLLLLIAAAVIVLSFLLFPPFGQERIARVLLVGLDDQTHGGGTRRSDTIILSAARLNGTESTLLSIPRDARVHIHRSWIRQNQCRLRQRQS